MKKTLLTIALVLLTSYSEAIYILKPECKFDETHENAKYLEIENSDIQEFVSRIIQIGKNNKMSQNLYKDFESLIELSRQAQPVEDEWQDMILQPLPGCPNRATYYDPTFFNLPEGEVVSLKHTAFLLTHELYLGLPFGKNHPNNLDVSKVISLQGNILYSASCESPINCHSIAQVYLNDLQVKVVHTGTTGGSTSAGGIIQIE